MQVPCHFVPQLQMEMLASGANSALIVSRSATKVQLLLEKLKNVLDTLIIETTHMHLLPLRLNLFTDRRLAVHWSSFQMSS